LDRDQAAAQGRWHLRPKPSTRGFGDFESARRISNTRGV
jgi:hypothetical protein